MRIAIGADHRGVEIKQQLRQWLESQGHDVTDVGAYTSDSVDYPDVAEVAAKQVAQNQVDRAILLCGTGIGMAIAANKVPGVRAHSIRTPEEAEVSRRHNNLNALCLSAELPIEELQTLIRLFNETEFDGGRHARRVDKLNSIC